MLFADMHVWTAWVLISIYPNVALVRMEQVMVPPRFLSIASMADMLFRGGVVCFVCPRLAEQVNAAAGIIQANVHADANIIVGALVDERCGKQVSVTVLATGFEVRSPFTLLSGVLSPWADLNLYQV